MGWLTDPPEGCAVGSSGPTLNPGHAIRYARYSAVENLAASELPVRVETVSGAGTEGQFELSTQALSGVLADSRIHMVWARVGVQANGTRLLREVFALACHRDVRPKNLPDLDYPAWIIETPNEGGRVCAVGVAGPTLRERDQPLYALRDAQRALAASLETKIEKRIFDDGRGLARIAREIEASPAAKARAESVEALSEQWYDDVGRGPLGLTHVLYGLACLGG